MKIEKKIDCRLKITASMNYAYTDGPASVLSLPWFGTKVFIGSEPILGLRL